MNKTKLVAGQKVKWGGSDAEIIQVMDDQLVLVKGNDGREYAANISAITATIPAPVKTYSMDEMKRIEFLERFAKELSEAGVNEVVIKNGKIINFAAKESLEDMIKKHQEKIKAGYEGNLKKAEEEARREFEAQNKTE